MKHFLNWPLLVGILIFALAMGLLGWVTDAPAYLGGEAATCNNCHVMDAAYENWYHGPHRAVAVCTDCHLPHQNFLSYYLYKGYSGMKDVYSFTTKSYPTAIRANELTIEIIQENCIRCHTDTVESMLTASSLPFERHCWDCHQTVAHGDRGFSLYPFQDSEIYGR